MTYESKYLVFAFFIIPNFKTINLYENLYQEAQ